MIFMLEITNHETCSVTYLDIYPRDAQIYSEGRFGLE